MAARAELPLGLSLLQFLEFFCSGFVGEMREKKPGGPTMKVRRRNSMAAT